MTRPQNASPTLLERPALTRRWPRPTDIQISDTQLLYRFKNPPQYTQWDFRFLQEFIALANLAGEEFADAVEKYACTWGVLELCGAHDAPSCHPPELYSNLLTDRGSNVAAWRPQATSTRWRSRNVPRRSQPQFSPAGVCPCQIVQARTKLGGKSVIELREHDFRSEPLSGWRFWSRHAFTFLKAVAADNEGRELPRADWLRLAVTGPREAPGLIQRLEAHQLSSKDEKDEAFINEQETLLEETLVTGRFPWNGGDRLQLISGFVNDWLDIANVQLRAVVENGRITMMQVPALESGWLFAAIATQLALIAVKAPKILLCSNCANPYFPENVPRTGENTYCPECGIKAARRDASKRYRRSEGYRRLHPLKRK